MPSSKPCEDLATVSSRRDRRLGGAAGAESASRIRTRRRRSYPEQSSGTASAPELRRHARRVALGVTVASSVVYLLAATAVDVAVLHHLRESTDNRLAAELHALELGTGHATAPPAADPDDAPIFAWLVPAGRTAPVALVKGAPPLPRATAASLGATGDATSPSAATVAGRAFAVLGGQSAHGEIVVGASLRDVSDARTTLLVGEAAVLPVMLLAIFLVAEVIGRRAAAPVERARRDQLEFTADASHELRTPLSVIEAEVSLALLAERDAAAYRAALQRVWEETARLRGIVDELMQLARADAIVPEARSELLEMGPVVAGCATRFEPVLAMSGGRLRVEVGGGDDLAVRIPEEWLDRLVSVLVDNACRYAGEGGTVIVATSCGHGRAVLRVEDSGPGIPVAEREAVLRRFHRAQHGGDGAGLGLSIAHAIVTSTAGRLSIGDSALGGAAVEASWPVTSRGDLRP